ncbi:MAG: threonylcarbamoyl-AMP synthase [Bacteroidia bacterium]|nr:threonylcarbamoyl-AMP synthase [Bacteroidia bacterium]
MSPIGKNTALAAQFLREGKLVAIPTETVYGLAALASDQKAVLSVFEAKKRPSFDPLILHFHSIEAIQPYAELKDGPLLKLAQHFWPGPLSLLLPKTPLVPDLVTSGLEKVAVRIPKQALTLALLKELNAPLAAPSANPFGYISPTKAEHVRKQLGDKVSYILDGGDCEVGLESTIIGLEEGRVCVYRLGGLSLEDIESVCGKVDLSLNVSSNPKAPGQLKSHYAPKKPLFFGDVTELTQLHKTKKLSIICFGGIAHSNEQPKQVLDLSPKKDLREAAMNLFAMLRAADESDTEVILAQTLPDKGLGRAINDRLKRASV